MSREELPDAQSEVNASTLCSKDDVMSPEQLIDAAIKGDLVGDGQQQLAVLVKSLRKWRMIAKVRQIAFHRVWRAIDPVNPLCLEHARDGNYEYTVDQLVAEERHRSNIEYKHSVPLDKATRPTPICSQLKGRELL